MQAALPHARAESSDAIASVASADGRLALLLSSLRHGAKLALEGISESANLRLAPLGIRARIVGPGGVSADFSGRSLVMKSSDAIKASDPMRIGAYDRELFERIWMRDRGRLRA